MTVEQIEDNLIFKNKCVLNFEDINPDTPVYRVYPIDRLLELFTLRKNTLVKPALWDDPFENIIFQQNAKLKSGETVHFSTIRERFYGQCWTLNTEETDALWRIYSSNKNGIRVKTTFKKLWDSYYNHNDKWAMVSFFIGKIKYASTKEIQTYFENPDNLNMIFSGQGTVQTLLIKRKEFTHENEIRLIYSALEKENVTGNLYQYSIDPFDLIDELLFDPRFNDVDSFTKRETEIRNFGFTKSIEMSKLYQMPNFNLQLNH